jgi:branched-chain amino acid transport system permease protein
VFRELEQYRMLIFGLAMVLIMIWRPRGLLSTREPTIRLHKQGGDPAVAIADTPDNSGAGEKLS